jgi:hypothetical protein
MSKHDHENKLSQTISTKNKFESHFLDHISHFETRRKTRYQYIFAAIRLSIHRNSDSFTESHQIVQKKKDCCEQKAIIVMFSKKKK